MEEKGTAVIEDRRIQKAVIGRAQVRSYIEDRIIDSDTQDRLEISDLARGFEDEAPLMVFVISGHVDEDALLDILESFDNVDPNEAVR